MSLKQAVHRTTADLTKDWAAYAERLSIKETWAPEVGQLLRHDPVYYEEGSRTYRGYFTRPGYLPTNQWGW